MGKYGGEQSGSLSTMSGQSESGMATNGHRSWAGHWEALEQNMSSSP
jgi:hypothetical protein